MADDKAIRLFIAIELPPDLLGALQRCVSKLERAGADAVRWVRPEGIHITLKFLGPSDPALVPAITTAVRAVASRGRPFDVRPAGLGTFGRSRASPRVVWVGFESGKEPMIDLARALEAAVEPHGFAPEKRPFSPHLTLGRVPDDASAAARRRLAELVPSFEPPPLPGFRAESVALVESTLHPKGAQYTIREAFPFGE